VVILILTYFTKREDAASGSFYFLCFVILIWNILHAVTAASLTIEIVEFFFPLQMLFIPFMPVALLLYVLKFTDYERFTTRKYLILLCILPAITVILNFTNDFHNLFRTSFAVVQTYPSRVVYNQRGPWFWVHTGYSYAAMILVNILVINKIRNVARASRLRYYMILLGCSVSGLANILVLFILPGQIIDSTLWGATFSLFFLYFAMDTSPTSTYILARNQVFEAIGEYIFVLDTNWIITDINSPARQWLKKHGIDSDPATIDILFEMLEEKGATIENNERLQRQELFFPDKENSLFSSFAIKRNYIYDRKKNIVGIIVTFSDMTAIRKTLRDLQAVSTIDELTGTYNRRGYERLLSGYNESGTLPLGIIMGDVNGLKQVNDTMGHTAGDELLRQAARILVDCIGEYGSVARIGGDEFAIITPNIAESKLNELIANIKSVFSDKRKELLGGGIAIGYAIKSEIGQDISTVIDRADKNMYEDKKNDRRRMVFETVPIKLDN